MHIIKVALVFIALFYVNSCASISAKKTNFSSKRIEITPDISIGKSTERGEIFLGGFSGLQFLYKDKNTGNLCFLTHTDREPNGEVFFKKGKEARVFLLPNYQPRLAKIEVDLKKNKAWIREQILLKDKNGQAITGLPNKKPDELPVNENGGDIPLDSTGLDLESIVIAKDGTYWMGDEYGPSLLHFSREGILLHRYSPGRGIPEIFVKRKLNRGFEGLVIIGDKIYAFLQSPIKKGSLLGRVLEFDLKKKKTTGQFLYPFDSKKTDKIGDAYAAPDGSILIIEADSKKGNSAMKFIHRVKIGDATNLEKLSELDKNIKFENLTEEELASRNIKPLVKEKVLNLVEAGFTYSKKAEGLAQVDEKTFAVMNDNDFNVNGSDESFQSEKSYLLLIAVP